MQLTFDVNAQTLSRTDKNNPATDSVDYLTVKFNFISPEWNGISKIALFSAGDVVKKATINTSSECVVPWEVLVKDTSTKGRLYGDSNRFYVSVVGINGTVQIPTVTVRVDLGTSGYGEGTESEEPTPDLYAQYVAEVKGYADSVEANVEEIRGIESGIKNSYANAFKGEASGEVVRVDDVSPVEHNARVKVAGKNLISLLNDSDINSTYRSWLVNPNSETLTLSVTDNDTTVDIDGLYIGFCANGKNATEGIVWLVDHGDIKRTSYTCDNLAYVSIYGTSLDEAVDKLTRRFNIQLEKGDVATEYTPYIDPSTVNVTCYGKNILEITGTTETVDGVTFTVNEDGSVKVNGTAETNVFYKVGKITLNDSGSYYLSGSPANSSAQTYMFYLHDVKSYVDVYDYGEGKNFTPTGGTCDAVIAVYKGVTVNNVVFYPMIEAGEVKTEFKKFEKKTTHTPNEDDSVNITSLSPTMTLLTDTDGVTIDLEYNRDTTAVMGDLKACLDEVKAIHQTTLDLLGGATNG